MDKVTIDTLDSFINTAAEQGVNAALEKYGEAINGREAVALSKLSEDELQTLARLNSKISNLAGARADWACGAVC